MILRSAFFSLASIIVALSVRYFFKVDSLIIDVGGLSAYVTVFGTLYGIMTAFVVFEVWNQYNNTSKLIDQEAQGLERLFRLTLYFRDADFTQQMKQAIKNYIHLIIAEKFQTLGSNKRNQENGIVFRKLSAIIRDVKLNDDHDKIIFHHIIDHYGKLSETRTERISQSLARLPRPLSAFLYTTSTFALLTFVVMPFSSPFYHAFTIGVMTFMLAMVIQLVRDLDNPFVGHFNITPEAFQRASQHIEEDY